MPGKQDEPNETEARRERVSWIKLVHLTWKISFKDEERDPVLRLFDDLGQAPPSHPIFEIIYHAGQMEAAIQILIDKFELDADHIETLRDIVQRTVRRN